MLAPGRKQPPSRAHFQGVECRQKQSRTSRQQAVPRIDPSLKPACSYDDPLVPKANPITPPQSFGRRGYQCLVDYKNQLYSVNWSGTQDYPDFERFPAIDHGSVTLIKQHPDMAALWERSTFFDYGTHGSIRISNSDQFPIVKLSHNDDLSHKLIQHELNALIALSDLGYHVADFNRQPIRVTGVVCGYRMKRLRKLDISEMESRRKDIREALFDLHSTGFCHGDLNPSNIMKDDNGRITLIDFSFTGRIGDKVPSYFPNYVYPSGIYDASSDLMALHRCIGSI